MIGPFVGGKKDKEPQIIYLIGSVQAILGCFCEKAVLEGEGACLPVWDTGCVLGNNNLKFESSLHHRIVYLGSRPSHPLPKWKIVNFLFLKQVGGSENET